MTCRALAVAEGELQRAGEQIAEYQNVNRDLVAQADDSKQHLQVKLHRFAYAPAVASTHSTTQTCSM